MHELIVVCLGFFIMVLSCVVIFGCHIEMVMHVTIGGSIGGVIISSGGGDSGMGGEIGLIDGGILIGGASAIGIIGGEIGSGGGMGGGVMEILIMIGDVCGLISEVGCCEGEILKYCKGGKFKVYDCTVGILLYCGWD